MGARKNLAIKVGIAVFALSLLIQGVRAQVGACPPVKDGAAKQHGRFYIYLTLDNSDEQCEGAISRWADIEAVNSEAL